MHLGRERRNLLSRLIGFINFLYLYRCFQNGTVLKTQGRKKSKLVGIMFDGMKPKVEKRIGYVSLRKGVDSGQVEEFKVLLLWKDAGQDEVSRVVVVVVIFVVFVVVVVVVVVAAAAAATSFIAHPRRKKRRRQYKSSFDYY
ncbi:hypothetical protein V1478_011275 [Vespula squamosa]|uniref:Uncharacterized protein n=1 Tax=Vespula squamosa TaxID=30214 RepID=A0ABD2AE03_VESSQ